MSLDNRVHEIQRSGNVAAAQLAHVANRLPQHVWLTSIQNDKGVLIDGESVGFMSLSRAISNLSANTFRAPVLISAVVPAEGAAAFVRYQLRLGANR